MTNHTVAVIQARMGSTRLPGKVMLPLAGEHVLHHVVKRVRKSELVDAVVVATSSVPADDILNRYGRRAGATVFRGSEPDVLDRMYRAASDAGADIVVRITADCPLIDPATIDAVIDELTSKEVDYASNVIDRSFPRGLDVEAFTFDSFARVHEEATMQHHREHVTPYYREQPQRFAAINITSEVVFDYEHLQNRTDLRFTLDEADDYEVIREIYENVPFDEILSIRDAIRYVDEYSVMSIHSNFGQASN